MCEYSPGSSRPNQCVGFYFKRRKVQTLRSPSVKNLMRMGGAYLKRTYLPTAGELRVGGPAQACRPGGSVADCKLFSVDALGPRQLVGRPRLCRHLGSLLS